MKVFSGKIKILLTTVFIVSCAYILAQAIVDPEKETIAAIFVLTAVTVIALIKKEYIVYLAIFLISFFYKKNIPVVYNSTNAIILMTAGILFIRSIIEYDSVISVKKIVRNPFWLPSLFILLIYLISWQYALFNDSPGMDFHTEYLVSIFCALLLCNIVIGFVQNETRSSVIQVILLSLLVANLLIGIISWMSPGMGLIKILVHLATGSSRSNVVAVGHGDDFAIRLGGLNFFWEAFAEYLMMASIILLGYLLTMKHQKTYLKVSVCMLLVLLLFELLLTNTRGATILAAIGMMTVMLTHSDLNLRTRFFSIAGLITLAVVALWLATSSSQFTLLDRFSNFTEVQKTEFGALPVGRAAVWLPTLRHISANGLVGTGPSFVALKHHLLWPHNLILIILSTIGIAGLGAYLYLFYRIIRLKENLQYERIGKSVNFYKYLWIAIIFFFIDTMKFDGFLREPDFYFYYMWFLISFLFTAFNLQVNKHT